MDDATELSSGGPGNLLEIVDVDEAERIIELGADISGYDLNGHPKLRRWDQDSDAIEITSGSHALEDGIEVEFAGANFITGDYWTFAARSITGEIEPLARASPNGVEHHYCPLAIVA